MPSTVSEILLLMGDEHGRYGMIVIWERTCGRNSIARRWEGGLALLQAFSRQ